MKHYKKDCFCIIGLLSLMFWTFGCNKIGDTNTSSDSSITSGINADTDTDSYIDTDINTAAQEPILFKLKNMTGVTLYITREYLQRVPFECERQDGDEWVSCEFILPWEQHSCEQVEEKGTGNCFNPIDHSWPIPHHCPHLV